jgi:hypothetical protein
MYIWVLSLWGIASLMACWSFSLFVRWVSEAVARRRKRFVAKRSTRSFWLGLALMFVCATVAVFAGAMAIHLEDLYTQSYGRWTTPIAIISGTIGLFGGFVFIWAIIGDRARGRVRCPKCWYDMSGAAGLQCPECGHKAKSTKRFGLSRRPRWAFAAALLMIGISAYGLLVSKRVTMTDYFAAVPSWVLMSGWEWLPENWILSSNSSFESPLEYRLGENWDDVDWVSYARRRRFGHRLARGLLENQSDRWDPKRLALIRSVSYDLSHGPPIFPESNWNRAWRSPSLDADKLLRLSAIDILDALTAENPNTLQMEILDHNPMGGIYSYAQTRPYALARGWISGEIESQTNSAGESVNIDERYNKERVDEIESLTRSHLNRTLSGLDERFLSKAFRANLTSSDDIRRRFAMLIANNAGVLGQLQEEFLDAAEDPQKIPPRIRAVNLGYSSKNFLPQEKQRLMERIDAMLSSDDLGVRVHALMVFLSAQRKQILNEEHSTPIYLRVYRHAIELTIDNHTEMYPTIDNHTEMYPDDKRFKSTFHKIGLLLMTRHDVSGEEAYPFVLRALLADPKSTPYLNSGYDPFASNSYIKAWVENFAQLSGNDDPDIKKWLVENLPVELGTEFDDLIDQIAVRLLDDPDELISSKAEEKLRSRLADPLLGSASEP